MLCKAKYLTIASLVWALPVMGGAHDPLSTHQLYPVQESGKWGYMDKAGKVVVKPQYEDAKDFSEGMGRVKEDGKWGFVNNSGELTIKPQYDKAMDFSDGMARVFKP